MPRLQEKIDATPEGRYDAILLGYGLCNNGIEGLTSPHTRIVVPKAHDCITLFLGNRFRYRDIFNSHPGTYYRTSGWIERADAAGADDITVFQKLGLNLKYDELVHKYGEDNAKYIIETMGDTVANYDRLAYISMGLDCDPAFIEQAKSEAAGRKWTFELIGGSMELLRRFIDGEWDGDFVVLNPGQKVKASHDDDVVRAV